MGYWHYNESSLQYCKETRHEFSTTKSHAKLTWSHYTGNCIKKNQGPCLFPGCHGALFCFTIRGLRSRFLFLYVCFKPATSGNLDKQWVVWMPSSLRSHSDRSDSRCHLAPDQTSFKHYALQPHSRSQPWPWHFKQGKNTVSQQWRASLLQLHPLLLPPLHLPPSLFTSQLI